MRLTEFVTIDFYNEFIEHCFNQVKVINRKIHECHTDINYCFNEVDKYYNYQLLHGIVIEHNNLFTKSYQHIKVINVDDIKEQYFVNVFNNLVSNINIITKLTKLIKQYNFIYNMPYSVFKVFLYAINFEVTVRLVKGDEFIYSKLGKVQVIRVPYKSNIPDWGQSRKFKEFLTVNGVTPKDKDNPNGKDWIVDNGLGREDFFLIHWYKYTSQLQNKEPYQLVPAHYFNLKLKCDKEVIPIDELVTLTGTGIFDKVMHMYWKHYKHGQMLYPFISYSSKNSQKTQSNGQ